MNIKIFSENKKEYELALKNNMGIIIKWKIIVRQRNMIWFNSSYNDETKTNIEKNSS